MLFKVQEKLAPINDQILLSAELIKGLVENSKDILIQVHETNALVKENDIAIKVRFYKIKSF